MKPVSQNSCLAAALGVTRFISLISTNLVVIVVSLKYVRDDSCLIIHRNSCLPVYVIVVYFSMTVVVFGRGFLRQ